MKGNWISGGVRDFTATRLRGRLAWAPRVERPTKVQAASKKSATHRSEMICFALQVRETAMATCWLAEVRAQQTLLLKSLSKSMSHTLACYVAMKCFYNVLGLTVLMQFSCQDLESWDQRNSWDQYICTISCTWNKNGCKCPQNTVLHEVFPAHVRIQGAQDALCEWH